VSDLSKVAGAEAAMYVDATYTTSVEGAQEASELHQLVLGIGSMTYRDYTITIDDGWDPFDPAYEDETEHDASGWQLDLLLYSALSDTARGTIAIDNIRVSRGSPPYFDSVPTNLSARTGESHVSAGFLIQARDPDVEQDPDPYKDALEFEVMDPSGLVTVVEKWCCVDQPGGQPPGEYCFEPANCIASLAINAETALPGNYFVPIAVTDLGGLRATTMVPVEILPPEGDDTGEPTEEPDCGDYCELFLAHCDEYSQAYIDMTDCQAACADWPIGTIEETSGDTFGCRMYHVQQAAQDVTDGQSPAENCNAAEPVSESCTEL